jgi:hypothetical protein
MAPSALEAGAVFDEPAQRPAPLFEALPFETKFTLLRTHDLNNR